MFRRTRFGTTLPGSLALLVSLIEDFLLSALEHRTGRDVSDRAVQPGFILFADELPDDLSRVVQAQWTLRSDTAALNGAMIAFQLAIAFRLVRAHAHVRHVADPNELLEITAGRCRR